MNPIDKPGAGMSLVPHPTRTEPVSAAGTSQRARAAETINLIAIIKRELDSGKLLPEKDYTFLRDMREKANIAGSGMIVNDKQIFWLRDIKDRLLVQGENGQ